MAINTGFQQQRPLAFSAAVRATPSPQHAARLDMRGEAARDSSEAPLAPLAPEEKSFDPLAKR